jgi:hypothetical protein
MGEKRIIDHEGSNEIYNDDWFLKDSILHDTKKVQPSVIKEYVNQGMATSQDLADEATARQNMDNQLASGISKQMTNLADFYDTTKSYVVGDVCVSQSGELVRCIAPTSGAYDYTKWEQVTVDELFDDLNFSAEAISYDNTSSGLEAENVQDAIDEVLETAGKVDDIVSNGQSLVENKIADLSSLTAVGTASGDIASFSDGSDLSMPKLEVAIEPVQEGSGDPSPENIRPISGWDECNVTRTGKNIYGGIDFANSVKNTNPSGVIDTTNKTVSYNYGTGSKTTIFDKFKPNTSYTFLFKVADCDGQNFSMRIVYTDGTNEGIEILPSDIGNYARKVSNPNKTISKLAILWYQTTLVKLYYDECGIFEGDIQTTDFASYLGQTITIDLDGTRYGGKVDLVSGVMTVTHGYADMGTLTWSYQSTPKVFNTNISGLKRGLLICSNYKYTDVNYVEQINDGEIWDKNYAFGLTNVVVKDLRYTSASDFKTAMNGVQLVYELATPLTIQLTPTVAKSLQGINNVFADTGNILDAEYIRDLTAIINYILEQLGN